MNHTQWSIHQEEYKRVTAYFTTLFGIDGINLADLSSTAALKCIDIACGQGNLTLELARRGHQVLAVDYSPKMIESLRLKVEKYASNGSADHQFSSLIDPSRFSPCPVECLVANGEDLSAVADNTFDVAVSNFGIYLFPNREAGFRAAYRVLKPNTGMLIATTFDSSFRPFVASRKITEVFGFPPPVSVPDAQTFEKEIKLAGFRKVKVYSVTHEYVGSSGERYANYNIQNPTVVAGITDPSQLETAKRILLETARGEKIEDKKLETSDAYKEPLHFSTTAHICIAIK